MQIIYTDLIASPFALPIILLHVLVFIQCAIKFIDYQVTKRQIEKLGLKNYLE